MSEASGSEFSKDTRFRWGLVTWLVFVLVMGLAAYVAKGILTDDWTFVSRESLRALSGHGVDYLKHVNVFSRFEGLG